MLRLALLFAIVAPLAIPQAPDQEVWKFDRLDQLGGHPVTIVGHPRLIDTPAGKAIEFNGAGDALFVAVHPLAGARQYTWEAVFRPDGGRAEQRWFHLQEESSQNRMLFEIRVIGDQWCLDAFEASGTAHKTLLDRTKLHPLGEWYHVAAVYDGHEFRSYVNGVLQ
ncbi:MAG: LamG-like jellyroll fold domain-containing protein, partial [Bryobacteraceae bacterium]